MSNKVIAVAGTWDSKGKELSYVKELIEELGLDTLTIDTGVFSTDYQIDVSSAEVASAVDADIEKLRKNDDRGPAMDALSKGFEKLAPKLYEEGKFDGIISLGGSGGTSLVSLGMQAFPVGVPKVIVSTMASSSSGHTYIGESDIVLFPSIVDVAGLNSISTKIFDNAVKAVVGMVTYEHDVVEETKPLIAATMFGNTTPAVNFAKDYLEARGYEVLVFHATGSGGRTMEHLIQSDLFEGVLDLTTTEWNDELFGGVLNAGPNRLEAAATTGTPAVVSVGAIDEINFGERASLPEKFQDRNIYQHNPTVTLVRTTPEENKQVGEKIAEKLNTSTGPTALLFPLKGNGQLSEEGLPFYDADADERLRQALDSNLDKDKVQYEELDLHINSQEFGEAAAQKLLDLMGK